MHGDGLPRLLTGDNFFALVDEDFAAREQAAVEKIARQERREEHTKALAEWALREDARKKQNEAKRLAWKERCVDWDKRRKDAREAGIKGTEGKRPTLGAVEKAEDRPKAPLAVEDPEKNNDDKWVDEDDD